MSIDQTYVVDTSLATFDVETLMTKAFEITHRLDGLAQYNGTVPGARAISEARAERDAIVREMKRRSDGMERALVTVEATERLMRGVDETLSGVVSRSKDVNAKIAEAREVLDSAMERTTTITCTLVKDMTISDRIAEQARGIVRPIVERAREVGRLTREGRQ